MLLITSSISFSRSSMKVISSFGFSLKTHFYHLNQLGIKLMNFLAFSMRCANKINTSTKEKKKTHTNQEIQRKNFENKETSE